MVLKTEQNHLIVCGLNYHSAPLSIRERICIPDTCRRYALNALAGMPNIKEAVLLSTCNRTEVYAITTDLQAGLKEIESFFSAVQGVSDHGSLKPNFKLLRDDAALHLLRVASGLDSMVLGEGQILSQVKSAHQSAQQAGTAGPVLNHLFDLALKCGKRVRHETRIGRRAVSVSSAAVELGRALLCELKDKNVLVVGAGKMGQMCLKQLISECSEGSVTLINRNAEKAQRLLNDQPKQTKQLRLARFEDRHAEAARADLVIICTSSPQYVFNRDEFKRARKQRARQLTIVDISVPRNVDPGIDHLPGVRLFDSDHLAEIVRTNLAERQLLVADAEHIVFETLNEFTQWQQALHIVPTITKLREKVESIRQEQVEKVKAGTTQSKCPFKQFERFSQSFVNQLLHHPTIQLKSAADMENKAQLLHTLFGL